MTKKTTKKDDLTKSEHQAFLKVASRGGKSTFKRIGKEGMSAIGKKGAEVRWNKKNTK